MERVLVQGMVQRGHVRRLSHVSRASFHMRMLQATTGAGALTCAVVCAVVCACGGTVECAVFDLRLSQTIERKRCAATLNSRVRCLLCVRCALNLGHWHDHARAHTQAPGTLLTTPTFGGFGGFGL